MEHDDENGLARRLEADRADLGRRMHVALPPTVDLSPARPDEADDEWGGNLVPMPISAQEREALRALGRAARDPGGLANAIRRYGFYADACGLGAGMDPDLVVGLRTAVELLVLWDGVRPAADDEARRTKVARLSRHMVSAAGHVRAVLSLCFAEDRRRTCRGAGRRA